MLKINREDMAWAAGFFDGEGNTSFVKFYKNKYKDEYRRLVVQIAQVDRRPLDRFSNIIGIGKVRGPYLNKSGSKNKRAYYQWSVSGFERPQAVIAMLWAWLSEPKIKQARGYLISAKSYYKRKRRKYRTTSKARSLAGPKYISIE